jgi:hypothetical protein
VDLPNRGSNEAKKNIFLEIVGSQAHNPFLFLLQSQLFDNN